MTFLSVILGNRSIFVTRHHLVSKFPNQSAIGQHQYQLIELKAEVNIIAWHFLVQSTRFKMEDFVKGITPNITSTQVCYVCCCNIDNVTRQYYIINYQSSIWFMFVGLLMYI